ncbi:tRNA glutamyl-Q(34) synthetase GluQRS [Paenibacillus allorhizosphaerae]|uniref:Glutamyl-Q tRNA(Asp) synthetase n=1 Tax=Paenibacillus allorhizosphaerae TaxID=2849866 RepID=A0ABN7TSG9_9BACL|nr:tRNA glutamyl-Q(34) synthetase GluQRS [Paenibacillus allorhizosphaerae]CAG7647462.1 Glutamate--tRNA ligase 1 [Paenibacillus allorhizosphaerae]
MKRGRFAPTPSGPMHLGNALSALIAWLHIRKDHGQFILRIEDIDTQRSKPEYARQLLEDLRWLGIDWDEGPDVGGPYAPYVQNKRLDRYESALHALEAAGRLYPCYCSRADLAAIARAPHGLASEGPAYAGTCRRLTAAERSTKSAAKTPSLRFALPDAPLRFVDEIQGPQQVPAGSGGDFVVKRADGMFGYQLAVVVDDAAMGVTHVVRGGDLLDSTPRQLWLYEALGLPAPAFAHVPLLLGEDGRKLSKRHGAVALRELQAAGAAPEQVVGWLAHVCGLRDRLEPVKASELLGDFRLENVGKQPIVVNGQMLRQIGEVSIKNSAT